MDPLTLAIAGSTGLQAIGSFFGGGGQSRAARDAMRYAQQQYADSAPYRQIGNEAAISLRDLIANPGSITSRPGYQFRYGEGVNALDRSAAARGMLYSGAQQRGIAEYGQNFATQELDNEYQRLMQRLGIGLQGTGMGAGALGAQTQAAIGRSEANSNRWNGVTNAITGGIGNYLTLQQLAQFGGGGQGGAYGGGFTNYPNSGERVDWFRQPSNNLAFRGY